MAYIGRWMYPTYHGLQGIRYGSRRYYHVHLTPRGHLKVGSNGVNHDASNAAKWITNGSRVDTCNAARYT